MISFECAHSSSLHSPSSIRTKLHMCNWRWACEINGIHYGAIAPSSIYMWSESMVSRCSRHNCIALGHNCAEFLHGARGCIQNQIISNWNAEAIASPTLCSLQYYVSLRRLVRFFFVVDQSIWRPILKCIAAHKHKVKRRRYGLIVSIDDYWVPCSRTHNKLIWKRNKSCIRREYRHTHTHPAPIHRPCDAAATAAFPLFFGSAACIVCAVRVCRKYLQCTKHNNNVRSGGT